LGLLPHDLGVALKSLMKERDGELALALTGTQVDAYYSPVGKKAQCPYCSPEGEKAQCPAGAWLK